MRILFATIVALCLSAPALASGGACPTVASYHAAGSNANVTLATLNITSCYYASSSLGSDSLYDGTQETISGAHGPWAHIPNMATCTSNCAAVTPAANVGFIMRTGDTWTNSSFPVQWGQSGTSGNPIFVGIDPTWGSGTHAIWTAGGSVIAGASNHNNFIWFSGGGSYTIFSGIEIPSFKWTADNAFGDNAMICLACDPGIINVTIDQFYVHGWIHPAIVGTPGAVTATCGTGCTNSFYIMLGQTTSPFTNGSIIQNSVVNGSDSTNGGDSGYVIYAVGKAKYNVISNIPDALLYGGVSVDISYNLVNTIQGYNGTGGGLGSGGDAFDGTHANFLEDLGLSGGTAATAVVHDNVIHDGQGEGAYFGCNTCTATAATYSYNNIWYNLGGNPPHLGEQYNNQTLVMWNNTIVPQTGGDCMYIQSPGTGTGNTLTVQNNHCVTTSSNIVSSGATGTINHNVIMTPTQATTAGMSSSQTFAYQPTNSNCNGASNCPIGQGTNLTSSCSGNTAFLCSSTSYGSVLGTGNISQGSGISVVTRPTGATAWDAGAFEAGAQASSPFCSPGSGIYSTTQTPACTNPNTGTTVQCYGIGGTTPATNGLGTACTTGTLLASGGTVSVSANVVLNIIAGTSTLSDSPVISYTYYIQAIAPTASPTSGNVPQTVTVTNTNTGTTVVCYNTTGSPATNGLGTGCAGGSTQYTSPLSVSSPETLYIVAGTSIRIDSPVNSYTYGAASNVAPAPGMFAMNGGIQ